MSNLSLDLPTGSPVSDLAFSVPPVTTGLSYVPCRSDHVAVRQPAAEASRVPGGSADVSDGVLLAHASGRVRGGSCV